MLLYINKYLILLMVTKMDKSELLTKLLITKKNKLTLQFLDKYCEKERKLTKHEQRIIKPYHERIKTF